MFCRQQVAELAGRHTEFSSRNARLAVIGCGRAEHLLQFRQTSRFSGGLFTDPTLESFKIFGFTRNLSGMLTPGAVFSALKAFRNGHRPATLQGDALQLGGALVLGPGDKLFYYFKSREAGHHPPVDALLEACSTPGE